MKYRGEVVDLFCGVGALSHGLKLAGFKIVAGYDIDERCKFGYEKNNGAEFFARDVSKLTASEIKAHFSGECPSVLAGCAPCQPFSSYKQRYGEDPKWNLVTRFADIAVAVQPDFITMENVPALLRYKKGVVFAKFCEILKKAKYDVRWSVESCERYGVPQRRRRLVVLASRNYEIGSLDPSIDTMVTVRKAIGRLPKLVAGKSHAADPLHAASGLAAINLKRIRASKPGGTWRDWPKSLRAQCHRKSSGQTYSGVYARMSWDDLAPTMTTQCYGFGSGRFGHPEQNRAISLREAALLQSFPLSYEFIPPGEKPSFVEVGRWIGNAVPVNLAEAIGHAIAKSKWKSRADAKLA